MYETPRPYKKARKNGVASTATEKAHLPESAKAARAHAKKYSQGPPLVPAMIVDRIVQYVHKAKLRRMRECVERICRYWSLKREARRGAPLLKRLYLEVRKNWCRHDRQADNCFIISHGQPRQRHKSRLTRKRSRDWK
jgi:hypothetical protein